MLLHPLKVLLTNALKRWKSTGLGYVKVYAKQRMRRPFEWSGTAAQTQRGEDSAHGAHHSTACARGDCTNLHHCRVSLKTGRRHPTVAFEEARKVGLIEKTDTQRDVDDGHSRGQQGAGLLNSVDELVGVGCQPVTTLKPTNQRPWVLSKLGRKSVHAQRPTVSAKQLGHFIHGLVDELLVRVAVVEQRIDQSEDSGRV
jgi:hypothetical protein